MSVRRPAAATPAPSPLTPELWAEGKHLLLEALSLPIDQRAALIEKRCAGRESLRAHLRSLLDADAAAPSFVDRPESTMQEIAGVAPTAPITIPLPGQFVGTCRLISLVGEGATGLVYLAEQARPRRQVAVKILRPGQSSPQALSRLEREAEIMARLRHPGIAQIIESGAHDIGPYFVMEYVEGDPVTRYARAHGLSIHDRLHLFLKVCDAAQHAHSMGVIHRDLKPANILVTLSGEPKILDFGVARALDPDARHATLSTPFSQLVGTLDYMSPEQAAGEAERVDIRADVYALGVILFELLAGRPPLNVASQPLHEALRMIQSDAPARLGSISRACRGDLETIVGKALEKTPERRYASVSELSGDIRRHLDRLPIHARPPSTFYELARFTQRRSPLVAGVAVALVGLVGALAWSLVSRARAHEDFLIARSVAGSWLPDVMQALERTPGTFPARQHMIDELRGPLERFAERYPDDLEVQAGLAALSFATGDLEIETGDFASAMQRYGAAFDALSSIAPKRPKRAEWRLRQSIAAVKIGDILGGWRRRDASLDWYFAALAIDAAAARDFPDNYTAQDQLVWSYDRLANTLLDTESFAEGVRYAALMEAATDSLLRRWPSNPKAIWCRIGSLHTTAHVMSAGGDGDRADDFRLQALQMARKLVKMDSNRGYVTGLTLALAGRASLELDRGNSKTAASLLEEAHPLVERALSLDWQDRGVHEAAASYFMYLHALHLARHEYAEAQHALGRTVDHVRAIARLDPSSFDPAIRALHVQWSYVDLLAEFGADAELLDAACLLRDDTFTASTRFPDRPEPYQLLESLCRSSALPAMSEPELAGFAAARAAERSTTDSPAH